MLFLVALVGAAVVAVVLWRAMNVQNPSPGGSGSRRAVRSRATGPDDDPEFLRQLDERVRRPEDPPS